MFSHSSPSAATGGLVVWSTWSGGRGPEQVEDPQLRQLLQVGLQRGRGDSLGGELTGASLVDDGVMDGSARAVPAPLARSPTLSDPQSPTLGIAE
jgi:hypothetical protein